MVDDSLVNKRILITRSEQDQRSLAQLLQQQGALVMEVPLSRIVQVPISVSGFKAPFDWVSFQSPHGVKHFFDQLTGVPAFLVNTRYACVGPSTARRLLHYGHKTHLMPPHFNSESLLQGFKILRPSHILIPHGDLGGDELIHGLKQAGWQVTDLLVYKNEALELSNDDLETVVDFQPQWIPFTSASSVDRFCRFLKPALVRLEGARFAAIGPRTREAMDRNGLVCSAMPEKSTLERLVEAIVKSI